MAEVPARVRATFGHSPGTIDRMPGAIHLWLVDPDAVSEELQRAYASLLSMEERAQQRRFHFERDRRRYLVTRALVRTVLSRYAPVAPAAWSFVCNQYGCPRIDDTLESAAHIHFNVSHTHGLIVLAVGDARVLGVDVENARIQAAPVDIADRYFAADEVAALRGLQVAQQQDRFFEYWTFKESYIKARGLGLSLPLDRFSFDLSRPGEVSFQVAPGLEDRASRWKFWQFRPGPEHIVALCAEWSAEQVAQVSVIRTMPLAWHTQQQLACSRISI